MFDLIKKSLEAALGAASVTQEKLKELADELVVKGHLTKKEGSDLIKSLKGTAKEGEKKLTSVVNEQIKKVIKEMGIATASDVKALKGKISRIEKELEKEKKKKTPAKKAAAKTKKTAKS